MKSLSLSMPHLIVVVGIPGAGKTHFAKQFADMFHAPLLSDSIIPRLDSELSPELSQKLAGTYTMALLPELLKTQKTILLDGVGAMRSERIELQKLAREAGYNTLIVWVQTDPTTAKIRCIKPPRGSGKFAMDKTTYDALTRRFSNPHQSEKFIVLSGKHTFASQAKMLLRKLSEPRASISTATKTSDNLPKRPISGNRISIN